MRTQIPQYKLFSFLSEDTRLAPLWLLVRLYVGWEWLVAGWDKVQSPAWVGDQAGAAVSGYLNHALTLTSGEHPAVLGWYGSFIESFALPNAELFSYLVAYGEVLVGAALILGFVVGKAAFFGGLMNLAYMFAGSAGLNPLLFVLQVFLVIAWRTAGWIGLDRWFLPKVMEKPFVRKFFT